MLEQVTITKEDFYKITALVMKERLEKEFYSEKEVKDITLTFLHISYLIMEKLFEEEKEVKNNGIN